MSYNASVFQILIASPSDVLDERELLRNLILDWNAVHSKAGGCVLLPVMWETHSTPEMGDEPQAILNRQIVDDCDALIGVFWTRIGTPTSSAASGTVEEINRIHAAGKPIMLYFSDRNPAQGMIDQEQWQEVRSFRADCIQRGIIASFTDSSDLKESVSRHLVELARKLAQQSTETVSESAPVTTSKLIGIADNLRDTMSWSNVDWQTVRVCQPFDTDQGKGVLAQLAEYLHEFRALFAQELPSNLLRDFDKLIHEINHLHRQEINWIATSPSAYWEMGDRLLGRATQLGTDVALAVASCENVSYSGPYLDYSSDELTEVLVRFLKDRESEVVEANLGSLDPPSGSFLAGELIHFRQLDDRLQLPPGTSRTLLREAASRFDLKIKKATSNTIQFE